MRTKNYKKVELKFIYILSIDNRGVKSKFYGVKKCYYVGQTNNVARRLNEHLLKINSKFLSCYFPNAIKKLVFIDYIYGNEYQAIEEETKIKQLSSKKKEEIIKSERNKLKLYIPNKCIVLKKYKKEDEEYLIRL